jgi:hypothetical protein
LVFGASFFVSFLVVQKRKAENHSSFKCGKIAVFLPSCPKERAAHTGWLYRLGFLHVQQLQN